MNVKGEQDINAEGCCTGKFIQQGGINGRAESTGLGVYYCIREMLTYKDFAAAAGTTLGIKDKTFVVQGFGAVGYWASKFLERDGGKITGVIEYNSAIFNPEGLDVQAVKDYMTEKGTLEGFPGAVETELKNPTSFLEKECDFLVPAAVEKSLHKKNAPLVKCKAIFEGANGPTTYAAQEIFTERGIVCIPDLLANGGGVTCSYFEWLKNLEHISPGKMTKKYEEKSQMRLLKIMGYEFDDQEIEGADEVDIVYSGLEEIMCNATKENWEFAQKRNLSFRDACLVNAINKVYNSIKENGIMI
jgi:glutamate dehydrogenase (NAD(P)+)